ncbi:glycosyltransferase family 9 protein, partial [Candidatus Sumerlaeota bacterium]|nr:glycosyltransferase family 9 protein [Candidatus Sumerlaeota bacterium]
MTPVPIHPQDTRAILVILPTWVGDFVMATPALRSIRRYFADATITFLTEPNLRDLVDGGDWMDDCVHWPPRRHRSLIHRPYRRMIGELRRRRFDAAILLPNSFRAAMVAWLGGARRIVGYRRDGRGLLLTDRVAVPNLRDSPV